MAERFPGGLRRLWVRLLNLLAVDLGPFNLAELVADRLFDGLTPDQRALLRQRFGVDSDTNAKLEEIAAQFEITRKRLRELEGKVLVRLYRWEYRKLLLPGVQRRLIRRIATAHEEILETLCDAPPVRPVLVGWHDQLVDGRRAAGEIAKPPDPIVPDDPEEESQTSEFLLASMLRKALWASARARKPVRRRGDGQAVREEERSKALEALRGLHLNCRSMLALAEAVLGNARRIKGDILEPSPALADVITAESGMPMAELWACASQIDNALARALHNQRLLVESCMPKVAEMTVARGLRNAPFVKSIERGRDAIRQLTDRFCFTNDEGFAIAADGAIRAAIETDEPAGDK